MSISLTYASTTIALPADMQWQDEFDWAPVGQSVERGVTGALIVQSRAMTAGRPVTLRADDTSAWARRSVVEQLRNAAAIPGQVLTLTINGQVLNVIFRHHDGQAVEAAPIVQYASYTSDDFYRVTLKFMTV